MARAGVNEIRSGDDDDVQPIELPGLGTEDEQYACCWSFWHLLSWVVSLVLYTIEFFVTIWAAYSYASSNTMFVPFGISLAYLAIPQIILVTISLTWYYNLDRYHRKKKESDPHNMEFIEYRKKFTIGAIVCHVMLLGLIYRYSQLIYQVMIRKFDNVPYLRRDAGYLRLVHSILVSVPLVILHTYVLAERYLVTCLESGPCDVFEYPSLYAALAASLATLLYSLLSFTTNDRFSGKWRRVIFPAHLSQSLWYLCMLSSRMLSIFLFAYAYSFYVFPFIGGHWIVMFVFLLVQRTTFCADLVKTDNSNVTVKRRWFLELPFNCISATMLVFAFFGFRRGKTRFWALFYHLLTYAEIVTMSVLFYIKISMVASLYVFTLTALTLALGLYPVGVLFMLAYYLFFHPRKTKNCYWIGVPKKRSARENITRGGFRNQTPMPNRGLDISGPTLVAHNGFIPRSMLPSDVPSTPGDESNVIVDPQEIIVESQKHSTYTEPCSEELNWVTPASVNTREDNTNEAMAESTQATMSILPSISISPSTEGPSPVLPSDLDTDITCSSTVLHVQQGEFRGDTVIDTPLFGNTPDPNQQNRLKLDTTLDPGSGTMRSRTDTVDTGIDVGPDTPLTQDNEDPFSRNRDNLALDIDMPQYSEISAKRNGIVPKRGPLEAHYLPEQRRGSLTPTLPAPIWSFRSPVQPSGLAHNSSAESRDMYPTSMNSTASPAHHVPIAMSTPERTRRNTPRSPKGARAFAIAPVEEGKPAGLVRNRNSHPSSYASHTEPFYPPTQPKVHPPRSPKGARRMVVSQLEPTHKQGPEQMYAEVRNQRLSNSYNLSRSPERRGVLNYQKQATNAKTPDGRRRNVNRPSPVQKSNSIHVPGKVRSPERQPGYRREAPNIQQRQYIQQQQENRSRWDRWAAEQEEKRRQLPNDSNRSSFLSPSYGSPQHRPAFTQSHPASKKQMSRNISQEFDHLEPITDSGDSAVSQGASVAPQGYPRMPQGARSSGPRVGWSPGRHSDRISLSPQRSIHSVPGISLAHRDTAAALSTSGFIPNRVHTRSPRNSFKMSGHGGSFKKFYAPTASTHQSVV